ncbi:C-terminal helicase domain-containing protein [Planctomycetota bacterium]
MRTGRIYTICNYEQVLRDILAIEQVAWDLIEPLLDKHKLSYVSLDGSVPQKKHQQLIHTFHNEPKCKLFITTNAGSTGLNLQCANTVINVDLPWNPAVLEQRIARAHRMGQKRSVQVYILVTLETLEENMLATLSAKYELALAALDSESKVDIVELSSGIEDLKQRLEVLLGARHEAPIDESEKDRHTQEAQRLAQRERVAAAGGQLISAAFKLLGELTGNTPDTEQSKQMTEALQQRLADCVEKDDQGRVKLAVTLPDPSALKPLAESLARFLTTQ